MDPKFQAEVDAFMELVKARINETTTAGGIPEIMGDDARLVPVDDVAGLAAEIRRFYAMSAAERAALGEHIAQRLSAFRLEDMQADYRELSIFD